MGDGAKCEFARAVTGEKGGFKFILPHMVLTTFTTVKLEHKLVLLNFHRHEHFLKEHSSRKCVGVSVFYLFVFNSLVHLFPSLGTDLAT